jgi:hypothetical protein
MAGEIDFSRWELPHPGDLNRTARETVFADDPDLAERNPELFEQKVLEVRQQLDWFERGGKDVDDRMED